MTTEAYWVALLTSHCPLDLTWHSRRTYCLHFSTSGFAHWPAAIHVSRYLRGTDDVGITFMNCAYTVLNGYTDSDYASCKYNRRSIAGFCFNVGSGAIFWAARRRTCVVNSTTEAEIHALSKVVMEAVHSRRIVDTLGE